MIDNALTQVRINGAQRESLILLMGEDTANVISQKLEGKQIFDSTTLLHHGWPPNPAVPLLIFQLATTCNPLVVNTAPETCRHHAESRAPRNYSLTTPDHRPCALRTRPFAADPSKLPVETGVTLLPLCHELENDDDTPGLANISGSFPFGVFSHISRFKIRVHPRASVVELS